MLQGSTGQGVKSVEVAGRVLAALAARRGPVALKDLAADSRIPAAKLHRYLVSLLRAGLVSQNPESRHYTLGAFAVEIGAVASRSSDSLTDAFAKLEKLRILIDETVTLSIWTTNGPVILEVRESSRPIVLTMKRGTALPMLSTATGIVFASFLPISQTNSILDHEFANLLGSNAIVTTRAGLLVEMLKTQEHGYALNSGHLLPDVMALAAPILDRAGGLTGVLAVFGNGNRIDPSKDKRALKALLGVVSE